MNEGMDTEVDEEKLSSERAETRVMLSKSSGERRSCSPEATREATATTCSG